MSFIVTKDRRLTDNTARIEALLLRPKLAGVEWTSGALHDALEIVGLYYNEEEMKATVEDLYKRGVVEDVKVVVPEPVVVPAPVVVPEPAPEPEP